MNAIDFSTDPAWRHIFYRTPSQAEVRDFRRWLRERPDQWVVLYHGTSDRNNILGKGLLPTTATRRRSAQSESGFVYLSVYPGMARTFGEMGYPGHDIAVYAVTTTLRRLKADTDQLRNQRQYADRQVGNTLAESLAYGHSARIRGRIEPMQIARLTPLEGS